MPRCLGILGVALAAAVFAPSAAAGDVRGTDPAGDLKTPRLTRAERAALDIRSVRVVGEEGLGAFVTVTFAGNVERLLGTGHLKEAVVGMVLRAKSAPAAPAGLLERGAELLPLAVRVSAKRVVHVQTTTAETYRKTRSTAVGVVRHANQLFFFVVGGGFSNVASVDVRTFASLPEEPGKRPGTADFEKQTPTDEETVVIDISQLTIGQLLELKKTLQAAEKATEDTEAKVATAREQVERALHDIGPSSPAAGALRSAFEALDKLNNALVNHIRDLNGAINLIGAELRKRNQQRWMLRGGCSFVDPTEVMCTGVVTGSGDPGDALQMVVPGGRGISAFLCPPQLPSGALSETSAPNDTLTCSGGTLQTGQTFAFNLRTSPEPRAGMGVNVFARQHGLFTGPFAFSGP